MKQTVSETEKKQKEYPDCHRRRIQKEMLIRRLKEQGCRITKQRLMLLDIILEENCSCCKEIYYKASRIDSSIGAATVYRMVNLLEEAGAISRRNMYRIACGNPCEHDMGEGDGCRKHACIVELEDNTVYHLSAGSWNRVVKAGLEACGYDAHAIRSVKVQPCDCE